MLLELLIGVALAASLTTLACATTLRVTVRGHGALAVLLAAFSGGLAAVLSGDGAAWPLAAALVALVPTGSLIIGRNGAWTGWARVTMACLAQAAAVYLLYTALVTETTSRGALGLALGIVLWVVQLASLLLTLSFAFEILDVLGRRRFPARDAAAAAPEPERWPAVCIQIPAYNEPPELLAETIEAVMRQDYPGRWMVQVVDNNTPDEATWRPIEELCRSLGDRVEFMHLADWPGYKSGALNEATHRLPDWVEVIAVVDADYLVSPGFLTATARHFADPEVGFVQTPQHYRDWSDDRYLAGLFYSYKYFFDVSMVSRHEHAAIIFGGTMGLIRRSALARIGGWDEWCITEDAEASLRLLGLGYRGVYDPRSYGAGLMPLSFEGLKKQRFRWAFGGVQILRKHARAICGLGVGEHLRLRPAQRIAYLIGGLQWFNEVLCVVFTTLLLTVSAVAVIGGRLGLPALTGAALVVPPLLIGTGLVRSQWALRTASGCSHREALRAHLVWFALSWVVARACVAALVRRSGTFLRTPKTRGDRAWQRAVRASAPETVIAAICAATALALGLRHLGAVPAELAGLLLLQTALYGAAPLCGLWAEGIALTPARRVFAGSAQNTGERPVMRQAVLRLGLAAGFAGGFAVILSLAAAAPAGPVPFSTSPAGPRLGEAVPVFGGTVDGPTLATPPAEPAQVTTSRRESSTPGPTRSGSTGATAPGPTAAASPPSATPTPVPHGSAPTSAPVPSGPAPTSVPTPGSSHSTSPPRPSPSASPVGSKPTAVPTPR